MQAVEIDISRALKISGWMNPTELAWLAWQASQHSNIAEIGSFMGRSTRALAENTSGIVDAIDLWKRNDEYQELQKDLTEEEIFAIFEKNVAGLRVYARRMPSLVAAKSSALRGETFDMVFVDGAHDYESVKADILAWKPLIKSGGLLCGHDFRAEFPGVTEAVLELEPKAQLVTAYTSIWGVQV